MSYGLEITGDVSQTQISSSSNNSCLVAYENFSLNAGNRSTGSKSPTALDSQDILFVRPTTTTGTQTLFSRWGPSVGGTYNSQYSANKFQIVPSTASKVIRCRASDSVSNIGDNSDYGLVVNDSAGNEIFDSRNVSGIMDIVDTCSAGISDGGTLFTLPTTNRSNYYVSLYNSYYEHFTFFDGTEYEIIMNGLQFQYSNNKVVAFTGLRQYSASSFQTPNNFVTTGIFVLGYLNGA